MWELLSTESDNEENSEESENKSWCVKWFLSMRAQLSLKSQDKGKAKWAVTVIVLIVILFLGLVLISTVREIEKRKDVEGYPVWEEVLNQVKRIEANHSELVSVQTIGRSLKGKPIQRVSVSANPNSKGPLVWIVCGLHAKEWVSPLFCVHILNGLIQDLPSESELQKVTFQVVPIANPDSYAFGMSGHLENRLKRKNMADSGCSDPLHNGVDLNRNFPIGFNLSLRDCTPVRGTREVFCGCSNTYGGRQPFSEPETTVLRDALTNEPPWLFIDVHTSFGAWMTPPVSRPSRHSEHKDAWNIKFVADFLERSFNVSYKSGEASIVYWEMVGGTMVDWVYEGLGVVRTYILELISGCKGDDADDLCHFQFPVEIAREEVLPPAWAGLKLLVKEALRQDFKHT